MDKNAYRGILSGVNHIQTIIAIVDNVDNKPPGVLTLMAKEEIVMLHHAVRHTFIEHH